MKTVAMKVLLTAVVILGAAVSASASPFQIYFNNFDGTQTFGSGVTGGLTGVVTVGSVQGYAGLGAFGNQFGGNLLYNPTGGDFGGTFLGQPGSFTILTLSNLPTHTSIDIDFLLAIIDSWDSNNGSPAPDNFNVSLDGSLLFQHTYANAGGSNTNITGTDIGSGCGVRGFTNGSPYYNCDRAFDASTLGSLNVAHTGSTATIRFWADGAGWQGGTDESWGIDNLMVTVNVPTRQVPEPITLTLVGMGLAGLALVRRRG